VDQIFNYYNQQLPALGWILTSGAPAAGVNTLAAEFKKADRSLIVMAYNTEDNTGREEVVATGYRLEIWYR
ncbi:MAG: hypothetical protein ACOY4Q_06675, partial [Bacillota bacterium]